MSKVKVGSTVIRTDKNVKGKVLAISDDKKEALIATIDGIENVSCDILRVVKILGKIIKVIIGIFSKK